LPTEDLLFVVNVKCNVVFLLIIECCFGSTRQIFPEISEARSGKFICNNLGFECHVQFR